MRNRPVIPLLLVPMLVSCVVQPVYYEQGVTKTDMATQAVLVLGDGTGNAIVRTLDGVELANPLTTWNGGYSAVRELRLAPGTHSLAGSVGSGGASAWYSMTQDFKAGVRYRISPRLEGYQLSAHFEQLDSGAKQ